MNEVLKCAVYQIMMHENGWSILEQLQKEQVDMAILDMQMLSVTGIDIIKRVHNSHGNNQSIPNIVLVLIQKLPERW
jgi:response regulator RpfG family c-di-GMP phosphodiesterase